MCVCVLCTKFPFLTGWPDDVVMIPFQYKDVFKYRVRGYSSKAKVIARDFPASNGMIHVVNELLINEPSIVGNKSVSVRIITFDNVLIFDSGPVRCSACIWY